MFPAKGPSWYQRATQANAVTVGYANESKEVNLMHTKEKIGVFDRRGRDRHAQKQGREPPSMHREQS
jgi:hypothetical protein